MREGDRQLSAALGRLASGLFVLTVRHGMEETGVLTSWVQQCAFEPPHISMALKQKRSVADWLIPDALFTLNILDQTQTDMVAHFGRGFDMGQPAFEDVEIDRPSEGGPVLVEALAYLTCRVTQRLPVGNHELFLAQVVDGRLLGDGQPMVHIRKSGFHY
jgi:flavin reductase (DIM6/NTAB) family NADH-FMN oxidoreductase RutF